MVPIPNGQILAPLIPVQTGLQFSGGAFITLPAQMIEQIRPGTFGVELGSAMPAIAFSVATWATLIWLITRR